MNMFLDIYNEGVASVLLALGFGSVVFLIVFLIFFIPMLVLYCIGAYKMMKKAGKCGWEIFIPFYGCWVLVELSGLHTWYFFLIIGDSLASLLGLDQLSSILGLVSLVATIFCGYNIGRKFNKGTGFAVAMALVPIVMIPIAGFSKDCVFDANTPVSPNGPIGGNSSSNNDSNYSNDRGINSNQNNNIRYCTNCGNKITMDTKYCSNCGYEIK